MRLYSQLCAHDWERLARKLRHTRKGQGQWYLLKKSWKDRGTFRDNIIETPDFLKEKGVVLTEPGKEPLFPPPPKWTCPIPDDPRFNKPPPPQEHVDWHDNAIHSFDSSTKMIEGEKQVSLLTRCHLFHTAPSHITDLYSNAPTLDQQDLLAQRVIMQANIWDPEKEKLPRRHTDSKLWKFKAERGIPYDRRVAIIFNGMIRLFDRLIPQYPELIFNRCVNRNSALRTNFNAGGSCVQISGTMPNVVYSTQPLTTFATPQEVDVAAQAELPSIYPLSPLIDLQPINIYKLDDNTNGWKSEYTSQHPHTVFIRDTPGYKQTELHASALMYLFGHCVAQAKMKYGADVMDLPEPIMVQGIRSDGHNYNFYTYQLNTLNLSDDSSTRNYAWIDGDHVMYERTEPKRAMLRNTTYLNYQPNVLRKMITYYVNGITL